MDISYTKHIRFGEDTQDINISGRDDDMIEIKQGDDMIWIPKVDAVLFSEAFAAYLIRDCQPA